MLNPTNKPHYIFFIAIPVIILIGLLKRETAMDINLHNTYYVISHFNIALLGAIVLGFIGFGYWSVQKANRKLSKKMNNIHIVMTFGGLLALFAIDCLSNFSNPNSEFPLFEELKTINIIITIIVLCIIFAQLVYLVNIITSIFRKKQISQPHNY